VSALTETGPSAITKGAALGARKAGYILDIVSLDRDNRTSVSQVLDIVTRQDFAAVFVVGPTRVIGNAVKSRGFTVPVYLESEVQDSLYGAPGSIDGQGAELAMNELRELGHTRIGHLGGPVDWIGAANREMGYRRALYRRGLSTFPILRGDWSARSGYQAGLAWPLDLGITAIFAANDQMALGLLSALHERGVSVPDQLSIVGFDDIPEAEFLAPPLTTIRLDFFDQGVRRIEALIAQIEHTDPARDFEGGVAELIRRRSAGPVPIGS
jgi:LacI family transcriptional regulator